MCENKHHVSSTVLFDGKLCIEEGGGREKKKGSNDRVKERMRSGS